ncbi:Protein CBR-RAD-54 [Caenorhabditis briggsae]|uniref:DNA repair and recombination protein RAD54-like n=1 Tax=Caenorhabditis briggsae TaxID=6238 RepID=A8XFF6_CAEBR|nr:Protein CBR-RAD-54 [Caenorhabditis briggsae]CAP31417.2 Protein CBR-RAD-54 [Caenorhabditis briggsae]
MPSKTFNPGDFVWAKFPGFPPWPAEVRNAYIFLHSLKSVKVLQCELKRGKPNYTVRYFGSKEEGVVKFDEVDDYYEKRKRFGKSKRVKGFDQAVEEIEAIIEEKVLKMTQEGVDEVSPVQTTLAPAKTDLPPTSTSSGSDDQIIVEAPEPYAITTVKDEKEVVEESTSLCSGSSHLHPHSIEDDNQHTEVSKIPRFESPIAIERARIRLDDTDDEDFLNLLDENDETVLTESSGITEVKTEKTTLKKTEVVELIVDEEERTIPIKNSSKEIVVIENTKEAGSSDDFVSSTKRKREESPKNLYTNNKFGFSSSTKTKKFGIFSKSNRTQELLIHKSFVSPFSTSVSPTKQGLRRKKKAPPAIEPPVSVEKRIRFDLLTSTYLMKEWLLNLVIIMPWLQSCYLGNFRSQWKDTCVRFLGLGGNRRKCALFDPYHEGALILYAPEQLSEHAQLKEDKDRKVHVVADPVVGKILRPHQRDGVKFMWDCVTGVNIPEYHGCIMADEMGLGKTLQCISLLWTLLRQSPDACPTVSKSIIVCPSSLVKNWDKEIKKWLGTRLNAMPVDSGKRELIIQCLNSFMSDSKMRCAIPVLIISYETFRLYANILHSGEVGIVICDEVSSYFVFSIHNLFTGTSFEKQRKLNLPSFERTEILVNFVNPGLLGTASEFRKKFENAILKGRDADASAEDQKKGEEKTKEMVSLVEKCIIRRTSALLTKYLPVKYEHIICCKNSTLQETLYNKLIECEKQNRITEKDKGATASALSFITHLKKLCNHPYLVYEELQKPDNRFRTKCLSVFPEAFNPKSFDPSFSGKMKVLDYILAVTRKTTDDKFVLVSNYTQTIDQFMALCKLRGYDFVRLDGSMSIKQRSKIVDTFNDPASTIFCFLLSSKAGGCGLNLIGANRLVMFDPDWNPANDDQAMARVWRDGQKKTCFIYRLLATGSIEEKMFQRQTHKKALSSCVVDAGEDVARHFSNEQLRELFKLESASASDTHSKLKCKRCIQGLESVDPPVNADCTSDLANWFHSEKSARKVADNVLRAVFECGSISFVFHQKSHNVEAKKVEEKIEELDEDYVPSEAEDDD